MALDSRLPYLLILLGFLTLTQAWYLDQSCDRPKREMVSCDDDSEYLPSFSPMILEGMKKAFDLTSAGKDAMSALKDSKGSKDQIDLLQYLFAFAVKDGAVQQSSQLNRVYDVFDQVSAYKKEADGGPTAQSGTLPTDEVIIFCDYSRMNENKDCFGNAKEGYACDTVTKRVVRISPMYELCKYGQTTIDGKTDTSEFLVR